MSKPTNYIPLLIAIIFRLPNHQRNHTPLMARCCTEHTEHRTMSGRLLR